MFMVIGIGIFLFIQLGLFYASYSISASIYLKSFCKNRKAIGKVTLTFDDGIDPIQTPKVLAVLARYNAKACFFLIGEKAKKYPQVVRQILAEGHEIGNHSMYHRNTFPMQSTQKIYTEVQACNQLLEEISGSPVHYFRPPFGVTNPMIGKAIRKIQQAQKMPFQSVGWSIRSLDTLGESHEKVMQRIFSKLKQGDILLFHDDRPQSEVLIEKVLKELQTRNYQSVSIATLQA